MPHTAFGELRWLIPLYECGGPDLGFTRRVGPVKRTDDAALEGKDAHTSSGCGGIFGSVPA